VSVELAAWLRDAFAAEAVEIVALAPLAGGAIQDNRGLEAVFSGGPLAGPQSLVLRLDAASQLPISHARVAEFHLMRAARAAGVTAPEALTVCATADVLGRPFLVMRRAPGSAEPRALTAAGPRPGLAHALGRELARLHAIRPPRPDLDFLAPPPADPARAELVLLRQLLDGLGAAVPALEWGLNRLEATAPAPAAAALCHRDFRTGNYLVADGRPTAILDWEFAGWGDPAADLAWLCAPCWRFARPDLAAGGVGSRADLLAGYATLAAPPDAARLRWWEAAATARWAVIALLQAARPKPSLELALTAHLVPELLLDLLEQTRPSRAAATPEPPAGPSAEPSAPAAGDAEAARLLALARETLKAEALPHLPPDRLYPARMALTALGVAARRAAGGAARRAAALATLAPFAPGSADLADAEAAIARRLRAEPGFAGAALHAALRSATRAACAEANPKARALAGLPVERE
jgi:aminoglycoside phosphotransferase (APT) family kinase protein